MKLSFLLLFPFILYLFSPISSAAMPQSIRIAVYLEAPNAYFEHEKLVGLNVQLSKLIAKQLKINAILLPCPFARCLSIMKNGQADLIVDINKTEQRQTYLTYLPPYKVQPYPLNFFTLKKKKIVINDYPDLKNLIIGVSRGYTYSKRFDEDKKLKKVYLNSIPQLVSMLRKERVDSFIAREESLIVIPEYQQNKQAFTASALFFSKATPSYLAISKKSKFILYLDEIEKSITILMKDEKITTIFK